MSDDQGVVERKVAAKNCVTIFGGGIAGLTAAHELVERGFRVQLWEPAFDSRAPGRGVDVGGMARTQWASVPWPESKDITNIEHLSDSWEERKTQDIRRIPQRFIFDRAGRPTGALGARGEAKPEAVARELIELVGKWPELDELYCEAFDRRVRSKQLGLSKDERLALAKKIVDHLQRLFGDEVKIEGPADHDYYTERVLYKATVQRTGSSQKRQFRVTVIDLDDFPDVVPPTAQVVLGFRVRGRWLPGEHGFRFFPSFYYHLFDTMKRTPILEPVPKIALAASQERAVTVNANLSKYTESGRTVYDNLRPTTRQAVGFPAGKWPTEFRRSLPTSLEELYEWSRLVFEGQPDAAEPEDFGLGFNARDLALFQVKIFQFLTSSQRRREDYEKMSWIEFLGGEERFSPAFREALDQWPQALVAMDARDGDARTQGAVFAQLLLDNLRPGGYRDGTLNGPTSEAWLKHWRRYLEAQGVEFIHGKLEDFRLITGQGGKRFVFPKVSCYEPRYTEQHEDPPLMPGYFVLALPAQEARRMARKYVKAFGESGVPGNEDLKRLATQRGFGEPFSDASERRRGGREQADESADLVRARPRGQLRHMVGIQFFFDEDISWLDGHAYFASSKWGLSSISQVRFWEERHDWEHGYRGILSVVIGVLDQPGHNAPSAWNATPAQIAAEVWEQIERAAGRGRTLPKPRYFHLDSSIKPVLKDGRVAYYENQTPYQINLVGQWDYRPGELSGDARGGHYSVVDGIVCAGTHMKTYTRLTTMEAANESARHAVNAILIKADEPTRRSPCEIWPIEERESDDLKFLKEVDDELHVRGVDHFLQILGVDEVIAEGLRGGATDPFNPLALLTRLRTFAEEFRAPIALRRDDDLQNDGSEV
jgi:hypothetical protein